MPSATANCTAVTLECPVKLTIYGYAPSLGFNAFFTAFFAIFALFHLFFGIWKKTYFFAGVLVFGCLGETIGYGGRIILHNNPWSDIGFEMQISCLIFSPAFMAAGIYLSLKHIVRAFGEQYSFIPAMWYPWLFITCDFLSLLLQAIGGGLASSANGNVSIRNMGTDLMIAGVVFQVITLLGFLLLAAVFILRVRANRSSLSSSAETLLAQPRFKLFIWCTTIAFVCVFIRCVYRIAELAKGWANPIMRDEPSHIVLEGFMIVVAVAALSLGHPGWCFPVMGSGNKGLEGEKMGSGEMSDASTMVGEGKRRGEMQV